MAEQQAPNKVLLNVHVSLESILDLTDPAVQAVLRTDRTELTLSWKLAMAMKMPVITHIANGIFASNRFQGMRFSAARSSGEANVIVWTDKLIGTSFVECNDKDYPDRIPSL